MLNRIVKLTEEQKEKLLRTHIISEDKLWWCNQICQLDTLTEDQYNTAIAIYGMYVLEQKKYVIVEDKLVLSPKDKKQHQISVIR